MIDCAEILQRSPLTRPPRHSLLSTLSSSMARFPPILDCTLFVARDLTLISACGNLCLNVLKKFSNAQQRGRLDRVTKERSEAQVTIADLIRNEDDSLLPINLLDGPSAAEILLSSNLRHEWRGFSFGNFWFGYYFGVNQPSPLVEERWAV